MANNLVTMQQIARQTLPRLIDNLVFPGLIHRDFCESYQLLGDTIQVRRPVKLTASEFDQSAGVTAQDIDEGSVLVTLDKIATVDVALSSLEAATSVDDLQRLFVEPAAAALAEKINSDGLELYRDIPYCCGTAGTAPDGLEDIAAARYALNKNRAPLSPRCAVWDTEADTKLTQIPTLVRASEAGTGKALREGEIGRVFGLDNYMSQAVKRHIPGSLWSAPGVTPLVDGAVAAGAKAIHIDGGSGAETVRRGDLITVDGGTYTVTADVTLVSGEGDVPVYPAVRANIADNTAVTCAGAHTANLAFHRDAFAFISRPLAAPAGVESYVTSLDGISLRVVRGYDMQYKREMISMDVLYGFKTMYPELAVRCMG